jgi:hypothetical protein
MGKWTLWCLAEYLSENKNQAGKGKSRWSKRKETGLE